MRWLRIDAQEAYNQEGNVMNSKEGMNNPDPYLHPIVNPGWLIKRLFRQGTSVSTGPIHAPCLTPPSLRHLRYIYNPGGLDKFRKLGSL
ncbi:hypothetical protein PsorP6_001962 [Peronosclerospora sorghi]|uniref:Uncharacterized protein n=1 Tax=Peronosclerospora sorghi TaxID=230839 RepID=A0ACC0WWE8_9STRA|nr:hypothetical protein PsorP6_001962 [Peronosclerospora sorghi]